MPFKINYLNFEPDSGNLIGGKAIHCSDKIVDCELKSMGNNVLQLKELDESIGSSFSFERRFKLGFVPISEGNAHIAVIEGCYINEPFNTMIIG